VPRERVGLLHQQMGDAYELVRARVRGLTDDEFFWEPAPGCWTVHPGPDGRWTADYAEPDPDPPTTIAWRLVHLATCKVMDHEYAFGRGELTWDTIDHPRTAGSAIEMLERGQRLLTADLDTLDDRGLDEARLINWGEAWPTWRIFWTMIWHDAHHGGEIGALRDLYRYRRRTG
jgi:hypothetical protein